MNKKKIVGACVVSLLASVLMGQVQCEASNEATLGDVTLNGVLEEEDSMVLRDYLLGIRPVSDVQKSVANVCYDEVLDSRDLLALRQAVYNKAGTAIVLVEEDSVEGSEVLNESSLLSFNRSSSNGDGVEAFVVNDVLDMGAFLTSNSWSIDCRKACGDSFFSVGCSFSEEGITVHSNKTLGDDKVSSIEVKEGGLFSGVSLVNAETGAKVEAVKGGFILNDQKTVNFNKESEIALLQVKTLGESFKVDDVTVKQSESGRIVLSDSEEQCSIERLLDVRVCYFGGQFLRMEKNGESVTINGVESEVNSVPCEVGKFTVLRESSSLFRFYESEGQCVYEVEVNGDFSLKSFRKLSESSLGVIKSVSVSEGEEGLNCSVEYFNYPYRVSKFCCEEAPEINCSYSGCFSFELGELLSLSVVEPLDDTGYCTYYGKDSRGDQYGLVNSANSLIEFEVDYSENSVEAFIRQEDGSQLRSFVREDEDYLVVGSEVDGYGSAIEYSRRSNESLVTGFFEGEALFSSRLSYEVMANHDYSKVY